MDRIETERSGYDYIMIHPVYGIRIKSNKKYMMEWIAKGFELSEVIPKDTKEVDKK